MLELHQTSPGTYKICWESEFDSQPVDVYVAKRPSMVAQELVASGRQDETTISGLAPEIRHYFELRPASGKSYRVAQRDLPLQGAVNFRDFGGYETPDGRVTKWGKLFRSGHLSRLTDADYQYISQLDLRTVCDFRRPIEIESEGSALPSSTATHNVPITPGARDPDHIHQLFANTEKPEDVFLAMVDINRSLIVDAASQYSRLFELLLNHQEGGFLMNCSAGKERTGVGAALLLMALGVDRAQIEYDFMLSGVYYPIASEIPRVFEKYKVARQDEQGVALVMPLLEAHQAYIQVVFDEIDARFASDDDFIRATYQLGDHELERLRETFTE